MDSDGWESMEAAIKTVEDACQTFLWLSIDSDMAHKAIDQIAAEKAKTTEKWSSHRVCALHHQVDNFATRYSIRSTGRLYTHANRLPKELRRALLIDGEATVELDVKNCQALLLTLRYPSQSEESKRWRALVENGTLYDEYAAEFGITRHEAKHGHFFPLLFGSQKPQPRRYFEKHFPEILAVIDEANKEANECRRRRLKTRKEGLAHDLQRIESKIIVEGLCKAFRAVSIHDGVRVKASEATAARAYLQNAFQSLGLRAKITVDDEEEPSLSEEELEKFGFQQAA